MPHCKNCGSEISEDVMYCPRCGAQVQAEGQPKLAYWGERFVAWLIDIAILGAIVYPVRWFAATAWPGFVWAPFLPSWVPFFELGLSNVVYFLYWMLMEGIYGQSIGKWIMRIKVVRLDGTPANMDCAAIESVGKAFLFPLDLILGWILFLSKRQRVFNYLSGTIVVRAYR